MFLGIDCGTQGTKALLVNEAGNALGRGYAHHKLTETPDGAREQDPAWWIDAMKMAVHMALQNPAAAAEDVVALGVSGQQHGLVVLDEACRVIRPAKLWCDTQTAPQNAQLIENMGGTAEMFRRFGIVPLTGYTVSKLQWLAETEPENFARIRHILLPHEYLNFWLTGQMRAEFGDASGTAFFDVRTRSWTKDVLDAIDGGTGQLFAALPEFVEADGIVGHVLPERALELGISPDCIVSAGGGDNMMGAIGTGNVREGVVTLSLGTSSTVYSFSNSPANDCTGSIAPFCSSSGGWLPLVCTMNATNVVTETVQLVGKTVQDIDAALESTSPGSDGLVFLPFLNGERTPDLPTARGSLHGIAATNFSPDHLVRSAVEGVSFGILSGLDKVMAGKVPEVIHLIGGGARSKSWRQLFADATGATIEVPTEEEAGCLGAAIQAIVAHQAQLGKPVSFADAAQKAVRTDDRATCRPRPEFRKAYDAARESYGITLLQQYPELADDTGKSLSKV